MSFAETAGQRAEQAGGKSKARFSAKVTRWHIMFLVQLIDLLIVFVSSAVTFQFRAKSAGASFTEYFDVVPLVMLGYYASCLKGGLYRLDSLLDEASAIKSVLVRWTFMFAVLAAAASLAKEPLLVFRLWFCSFYLLGRVSLVAALCCGPILVRRWVRAGNFVKSVVFLGANDMTSNLVSRLVDGRAGINLAGVFDLEKVEYSEPAPIGSASPPSVPLKGGVDQLLKFTKARHPDLVTISLPLSEAVQLMRSIRCLRPQPLTIRLLPGEIALQRVRVKQGSGFELPGLQLLMFANQPISLANLLVKAAIDRVAADIALATLLPLFLMIACAIVMASPGAVFFRQAPVGYNGHVFQRCKFRTMHYEFPGSYALTMRGDHRIFKVG